MLVGVGIIVVLGPIPNGAGNNGLCNNFVFVFLTIPQVPHVRLTYPHLSSLQQPELVFPPHPRFHNHHNK